MVGEEMQTHGALLRLQVWVIQEDTLFFVVFSTKVFGVLRDYRMVNSQMMSYSQMMGYSQMMRYSQMMS
jgi:hypothetical protein